MKTVLKHLTLIIILFSLTTCEKYDEGGLVRKRIKSLFGKNEDHATKLWKLKLYEVNGIDSTSLFQGSNLNFDDNGNYMNFQISYSRAHIYHATTYVYVYGISIDKDAKLLSMGSELHASNNDTSQCFLKNNIFTCQRNIFNPEKNKFAEWGIKKLTENELIIVVQLINNYKIILTH